MGSFYSLRAAQTAGSARVRRAIWRLPAFNAWPTCCPLARSAASATRLGLYGVPAVARGRQLGGQAPSQAEPVAAVPVPVGRRHW